MRRRSARIHKVSLTVEIHDINALLRTATEHRSRRRIIVRPVDDVNEALMLLMDQGDGGGAYQGDHHAAGISVIEIEVTPR